MARYIATRLVFLVVIIFFISILAFLLVHLLPGDPTLTILGPNDTPTARAELLETARPQQVLAPAVLDLAHQRPPRQPGGLVPHPPDRDQRHQRGRAHRPRARSSSPSCSPSSWPSPWPWSRRCDPTALFDRIATTLDLRHAVAPHLRGGPAPGAGVRRQAQMVPATGFDRLSQGLGPNLKSVILPSVALAIGSVAIYYRLLRADLIATLQEDFVTMARSKGLSTPLHPRSPRAAAVVVLAAGRGRASASAPCSPAPSWWRSSSSCRASASSSSTPSTRRDYLVVQGMALVAAVAFVVINFGVDFLLTVLDPRVRRA